MSLQIHNPEGDKRVIVTKELPGERWLEILTKSGCRVEISKHEDTILSNDIIKKLMGDKCHGVLGQLTEASHFFLSHKAASTPKCFPDLPASPCP